MRTVPAVGSVGHRWIAGIPLDDPLEVFAIRRRVLMGCAGLACVPTWGNANPGAKEPSAQLILPAPVQELVESSGLPSTCFGLHAQQVGRAARAFISLNAHQPFQMASTTKLVTALAALDLLGAEYRWRTHAFLDGSLNDGRLLGDLVIVGGGDASLSSDALRAWFEQMVARGLREVWGDIVLDRFAFELNELDHANTPRPAQDEPGYVRPDALTVDEGLLRVTLQTTPRGRRANVRLTPRQAGMRVVNQLTVGRACYASARLDEGLVDARLVVRGEWSAECGDREIAHLAAPHADFTARAVAELWRESGGRIKGRVRSRADHERTASYPRRGDGEALEPWASLWSAELPLLIREMNKTSDNLAARSLFLSLVSHFPAQAATLPAARARLAAWLWAQGLRPDDIRVDNGAGLSRTEKCKPRALVQLLNNAWQGPHSQAFFGSLPIAGVDGTLGRRLNSGAAAGRAHLKTGTGTDTRALAGYVRCRSSRTHAVAVFVNHPAAAGATATLDGVIDWLAANG